MIFCSYYEIDMSKSVNAVPLKWSEMSQIENRPSSTVVWAKAPQAEMVLGRNDLEPSGSSTENTRHYIPTRTANSEVLK